MLDLLIAGGRVVTPGGILQMDIGVRAGAIAFLGEANRAAAAHVTLDAQGLYAFPGLIDGHVHFRDPGLTHKEDLASGSAAAAYGGVTTFVDMPNTDPPPHDCQTLQAKRELAERRSYVDFGLAAIAGAGSCDM